MVSVWAHRMVIGKMLQKRPRWPRPIWRGTGLECGRHSLHGWKSLLWYGSCYLHSSERVCPWSNDIAVWGTKPWIKASSVKVLVIGPYTPSVHAGREGGVRKSGHWPRTRVGRKTSKHIAAMMLTRLVLTLELEMSPCTPSVARFTRRMRRGIANDRRMLSAQRRRIMTKPLPIINRTKSTTAESGLASIHR